MSCRVVYIPPKPHKCDLPQTTKLLLNTVIQCDECGRLYRLVDDQRDGTHWVQCTLGTLDELRRRNSGSAS